MDTVLPDGFPALREETERKAGKPRVCSLGGQFKYPVGVVLSIGALSREVESGLGQLPGEGA